VCRQALFRIFILLSFVKNIIPVVYNPVTDPGKKAIQRIALQNKNFPFQMCVKL
jgi:hypothetical protein